VYVLSHAENQGTDTYAQFAADETQTPNPSCQSFDSQVDAGDRFFLAGPLGGALVAQFNPDGALPSDVGVTSLAYVATGPYSTSLGGTPEGDFYFYDFEIDRNQVPAPLAMVGAAR
jgi:hypothetical protein